ncbi:MAG: sigma-70 family RNA polymerase sigma factor [Bacteroidia bacterium]|nr:sigma-70 family RNA polymerase sigma factor [Bacteroidia bacterium]
MTGTRVPTDAAEISDEWQEVQAAQKDPQAFRPLYERYYRSILRFVYNRVENRDLAFDITSQVFCEAICSLKRYTTRGFPFSSWLFRIALNILGKHYRSGKVRRTVSIREEGIALIAEECGSREQDETLFRALQTLEETEVQLVEMRFFEQRSFAEIAGILGISESAAKQRLYKVLELLKKEMKGI